VSPLLLHDDMTTATAIAGSPSASSRYSVGEHNRFVHRLLSISTLSDRLPHVFSAIVTNGKITAAAVVALYLLLMGLWLPFWLLSFALTEWGVYGAAVAFAFLVGRAIIRLIAFPGASRKVTTDIEAEFAKYSVRMIVTATSSLVDLATVLDPPGEEQHNLDNRTLYQLPGVWNRVKSFRDRVLGVYFDVLSYMHQDESMSSLSLSISSSHEHSDGDQKRNNPHCTGLTRYGNNHFSGDIGSCSTLTVRFVYCFRY
jgi:hypothetical protein